MVKCTPGLKNSMNTPTPTLSGNSHNRCRAEKPKSTLATIHRAKTKVAAKFGIVTMSPLRSLRRVSQSCQLTQAVAATKTRVLRTFTAGCSD